MALCWMWMIGVSLFKNNDFIIGVYDGPEHFRIITTEPTVLAKALLFKPSAESVI